MNLEIFWRVPLDGDGRSISASLRSRGDYSREQRSPNPFARTGAPRDGYTYHDLILQAARAAELNGFDGLRFPESDSGEDPFVAAASVARDVKRLQLVPASRVPLLSAVYATKIAVSFQRLTGGRVRWNLVTLDDADTRPWHGRRWSEREQLERTSEFLDVAKGFWQSAPFTYQGKYYEVVNGGFAPALQGEAFPTVYFGGTSDDALALSAKHADVHVFPIAPRDELAASIARLKGLAADLGRTIGVAVESDILARHTTDEAWADARRQWEDGSVQKSQAPDGEARSLRPFEQTRSGQYLWSGYGTLRPGAAWGLVGSYSDLALEVGRYVDLGVQTFIFGANPHVEEAYRLGEHFLPFVHQSRQRIPQAS